MALVLLIVGAVLLAAAFMPRPQVYAGAALLVVGVLLFVLEYSGTSVVWERT